MIFHTVNIQYNHHSHPETENVPQNPSWCSLLLAVPSKDKCFPGFLTYSCFLVFKFTGRIIQYVLICGCLLSFNVAILRVVLSVIVVYSFSLLCNILYVNILLSILLLIDIEVCLDLAIINHAAVHILLFAFYLSYIHISVGYLPKSRIAGS